MLRPQQSDAHSALPPAPARLLARPLPLVEAGDPLAWALPLFRQQQVPALPVALAGELVGWLREARAAGLALAEPAAAGEMTVGAAMEPLPGLLAPETQGDDLTAAFRATGAELLPVLTPAGHYLGCVTRLDALAARDGWFPPPRLGGMATPLGVYLTTGIVSGGAGTPGLILVGMLFAVMMHVAQLGLVALARGAAQLTGAPYLHDLTRILAQQSIRGDAFWVISLFLLSTVLLFAAFLLLLRFLPRQAGFHAAEHQTVNAIEAGEPLTPEAVGRMSRIHPRCGTNLWSIVALSYLGVTAIIGLLVTGQSLELAVSVGVLGILGVAAAWRHIGGWLQAHCTTRPATPRELASGIAAGREVLRRYLAAPAAPSRGVRLWRMGLLQVLIGVMLMGYLLQWIDLHLLDDWWHNLVK